MTIEQRLEKLERTVRRYQLAFGILGLALLATTAIACSQQALAAQNNAAIPEVIRARKFEVVAKNGYPLITMQTIGDSSRPGHETVGIFYVNDAGGLLGGFGTSKDGGGMLTVSDGKPLVNKVSRPPGATIWADPTIGAYMTFTNGLDKQVVYIGSGKTNTGLVIVCDVNGKGVQSLSGSR